MTELIIDPYRFASIEQGDMSVVGIPVRARHDDYKWSTVDIMALTKESLLGWLKSRGGDNPWAEDVVGIIMNHGHLHDPTKPPLINK